MKRDYSTLALLILGSMAVSLMIGCAGTPASSNSSGPASNPPGQPTGVSATAGNGSVLISWSTVTEATTYNIKN